MERTKTVEVIATRDENGDLVVWRDDTELDYFDDGVKYLVWSPPTCAEWEKCVIYDNPHESPTRAATAFIGGTYCGIKKGGKKRLRVTTTVVEVK